MYEAILEKLGVGGDLKGNGQQVRCPAHEDTAASLAVKIGDDGTLLVKCHAGCTFDAICGAIGVAAKEFFPPKSGSSKNIVDTYDYRDANGVLVYQVVRFEPKGFAQRKPAGKGEWVWSLKGIRQVLYGLPELAAANPARAVFVVEGEKDVATARSLGLVATCNSGGAGKWPSTGADTLRARPVIIIPDNDKPGREHAAMVAGILKDVAKSVRVLELPGLPEHGDLTDWVAAGGTAEELRELLTGTANKPVAEVAPALNAAAGGGPNARHAAAVSLLRNIRSMIDQVVAKLEETP